MAINVKELRQLLSQFPDEMTVIVKGCERTSDFISLETVEIVEAITNRFGFYKPEWMVGNLEKSKDKKEKFVYVGPWL